MAEFYFPLVYGNKLTTNERSDWSGLPAVFTLEHTTKLVNQGGDCFFQYQTDEAGLLSAWREASSAAEAITRAVEVIGKLMVYADHSELTPGDHADIVWLLCGLGELCQKANEAHGGFSKAIRDGNYLKPRTTLSAQAKAIAGSGGDHE